MNYLVHLIIYFDIYVIVALSLNLVVGYCGMLTLAHAGYFALGAYTYALLSVLLGWSFLPSIGMAISISALLSIAVSMPAWRLRGDFFVLGSLAVQILLFTIYYNWADTNAPIGTLTNLTNGPWGIANIPKAELFGIRLADSMQFFWLASAMAGVCAFILWRLTNSPWGRALVAMREDELATRGLGKNTRLLKVQAMAISCGMAGAAGALYASYVGYIDPGSASIEENILMLSMVLVGGVGNFRGPVIGALILLGLPEVLRFLHLPDAYAAGIRLALFGAMLVALMHFRPQGVGGIYRFK